jgi:ATP-binding cassette subfamily C protein
VALVRTASGYRFDDPAGSEKRVDACVAQEIESEAFILYQPLPVRALTLIDLWRAAFANHRRELRTVVVCTVFSGLIALLTPVVTKRIAASTIPQFNHTELLQLTLALGAAALAAALFELVRGLTLIRLKSKTSVNLDAALWDRLLSLPVSFFRRHSVGDLMARSSGTDQVQQLLTPDVTGAFFALVSALFGLVVLFQYSVRLALLATGSAFLLGLLTALLATSQLRHLRSVHKLNGRISSLVYSLLNGIAKLRVSGCEAKAFRMWASLFREQRRHAIAVRSLSALQSAATTAVCAGTSTALFALAAFPADSGLGIGDFLAFSAAFGQFQSATVAFTSVIPALLSLIPTFERMQPILRSVPEARPREAMPAALRGQIELCDVTFRYQDRPAVLNRVSIEARPGEFVAIVGPSGSGKSTCLRLILGFEQPESGAVLIDGAPLASLNMEQVRREFGVVLQSGRPLVGDIFRSIIGALPLTLEDAWRAARFVGLEGEIRSMPMGMFTVVNARGVSFSGGQRQRLLLARAIVTNPRVVLLDEATSALDNRTQETITRNLASLGVTRMVIAHRLSTVRQADRIYVLDRGRVVEHGTFDELMTRGNLFTRMVERQLV